MTILISIAAFLIAISILISFHEFGHYWVARRCGVCVLRFSVGFGRPLCSYISSRTGTEWVLARWPLGGYVQMLDKRNMETEIEPELLSYEFTNKPLYQRALIILAGPVFNFILAILLYAMVFWIGDTGSRPVVGHVQQESPAAEAGLTVGDEVLDVNGVPVLSWTDVIVPLLDSGIEGGVIDFRVRTKDGLERQREIRPDPGLLKNENVLVGLGFGPMRATSAPIIGAVESGSAADTAGLQAGDRVLRFSSQPVASWQALVEEVRAHGGQRVWLDMERNGQLISRGVLIDSVEEGGVETGRLGVAPYVDEALREELRITVRRPLGQSLILGVERTWDYSVLTLQILGRLVIGEASFMTVSGPVGIAAYAGSSAMNGFTSFLSMMALLSLSLGILNLLPIPILDGGHLVWCAVEAVTRRPVAEKVEAFAQRLGLVLLSALMLLALYNDIIRLMG